MLTTELSLSAWSVTTKMDISPSSGSQEVPDPGPGRFPFLGRDCVSQVDISFAVFLHDGRGEGDPGHFFYN